MMPSRDVLSAHRFYCEINDDNDQRVDSHAFARARLFDMLLSDFAAKGGYFAPALEHIAPYSKVPVWNGEANSIAQGGLAGVSDTFASVLWLLDYSFNLASMRIAGIMF